METVAVEDIKEKVHKAVEKLLAEDGDLLVNDANERTITHRFAVWLEPLFNGWKIDCEYNRHEDRTKRLKSLAGKIKQIDDTNGVSVFPDIIIHKRMTDENLLVIEVKKSTNSESNEFDLEKLCAFREELGYRKGLFIHFLTGNSKPGVTDEIWL